MADFTETRIMLEGIMRRRDGEALDLGMVRVERGLVGELQIIDGERLYSMDRIPIEVFDRLSKAIEGYRELSTKSDFSLEG